MNFYKLLKMDYQKLKEANLSFAFEELKKDADRGHRICQFQIAMMYENGIGTEKNLEKAFEYYEKAANQEDATAQSILGCMYETGTGTAQNLEKAFEYFQKSADQGHAGAQLILERMYRDGNGTEKNPEKALDYFWKAIEKYTVSKSAIPSVIQISEKSVAIQPIDKNNQKQPQLKKKKQQQQQLQQPIQPIAVKRPFILNVSESSAFSSAKKQTIQIE